VVVTGVAVVGGGVVASVTVANPPAETDVLVGGRVAVGVTRLTGMTNGWPT
jgi:hypothetical protein